MRFVIAALTIGMSFEPASAQNRSADEAAVRGVVTAVVGSINRRDASGYAALFTVDADVIILDRPRAQGRAAIQTSSAQAFAAAPNERATITPTDVRFVGSDVAIVNTMARFTGGPAPSEDRGTWVLHRQGNAWQITSLRVMPAVRP